MADDTKYYTTLDEVVTRLNALASGYQVGELQALRKEVKGLSKRPKVLPFPAEPNNEDWFFHVGGRQELQFNIGHDRDDDGSPALRHGIAFSFEPGPDLTDPKGTLQPYVDAFNSLLTAHLYPLTQGIYRPRPSQVT